MTVTHAIERVKQNHTFWLLGCLRSKLGLANLLQQFIEPRHIGVEVLATGNALEVNRADLITITTTQNHLSW